MPMDSMTAKIAIAAELQRQSGKVFDFRVKHFAALSVEQRLQLKEASRLLNSRADEVLEDALEEGTQQAEELIAALRKQTQTLRDAEATLEDVATVLSVATKVAKAAAGIVSGGIANALPLLA